MRHSHKLQKKQIAILEVQGHTRSIISKSLKSLLPVLVMIAACLHLSATVFTLRAYIAVPLFHVVVQGEPVSHIGTKFWHQKVEFLGSPHGTFRDLSWHRLNRV